MSSEENEFLPSEIDFERALLRKSVGTQVAARPRCRDCGRTPLVGEQMYVYSHGNMFVSYAVLCVKQQQTRPIQSVMDMLGKLFEG